jgi:transcriptional regulator with XRE-family HTH domain
MANATEPNLFFSRRLRQLRKKAGLSQSGLATLVGTSANHIAQMERGRSSPTLKTLFSLTRALGVSLSEFDA